MDPDESTTPGNRKSCKRPPVTETADLHARLSSPRRHDREGALDDTIRRFGMALTHNIRRFGVVEGDTEDVLNTVWWRLIVACKSGKTPRDLAAWLSVVSRSAAIDWVRKHRGIQRKRLSHSSHATCTEVESQLEVVATFVSTCDHSLTIEFRSVTAAWAFIRLTPEQRELLVGVAYNFSNSELAFLLGKTNNCAFRKRKSRAKGAFRALLRELTAHEQDDDTLKEYMSI